MAEGDGKREILQKVASGEIDPAEASRLLDELAVSSPEQVHERAPVTAEPLEGATLPSIGEIRRVQVRATSRRVRVIGDPTVATAAIDGPHSVRRDGSTLLVAGETELVPTDNAFVLLVGGRWREVADQVQHSLGQGLELTVRVQPDIPVGVEVIAGSLSVEGVPHLDHVRMTAGSLRVRGAQSPIDLLMQAGSAQVHTVQTYGQSRFRCESGSLQLTLENGSDARVRSDVQLGRFSVEPERRNRDRHRDVVVGLGGAEIDVEVVMGSVTLRTPDRGDVR
ncbi:hypothetical protein [Phytoactinopolyspora limicola]|uniref:hypothetical protein n=1 Tax=Phytoactinopolyspora limicola TaxID=2715536 RepID=UPI00140E0555|nr:hypothetical protein [Phytoactinopolyspora limicola]